MLRFSNEKIKQVCAVNNYTQQNIFSTARIVCFTNLQRADAPVIPLGVIGQVNVKHLRGYGLYARSQLTEYEHSLLDSFTSNLLKDPCDHLRSRIRQFFDQMSSDTNLRGHLLDLLQANSGTIAFINDTKHKVQAAWIEKEFIDINTAISTALRSKVKAETELLHKETQQFIEQAKSFHGKISNDKKILDMFRGGTFKAQHGFEEDYKLVA